MIFRWNNVKDDSDGWFDGITLCADKWKKKQQHRMKTLYNYIRHIIVEV